MASFSSSSSMILHQALELNEDGIFELSCGRSGPTVSAYFEEAAHHLRRCLNVNRSCDSPPSLSATNLNNTSRVQIPHLHDDLFYIYPCAMSYDVSRPPNHDQCSTHCAEVIFGLAVILFNLALCHHQQAKLASKKLSGINGRREEEECLRYALRYYRECHQVLQSLSNNRSSNDDLLLMTLAVMNNQAQILYELNADKGHKPAGRAQESSSSMEGPPTTDEDDAVFQKLLTYSMNTVLSEEVISNLSMVEKSQINEIVQNAIIFRLQRPCVAPSA